MKTIIPFEQLPTAVTMLSDEIKELKNILLKKVEYKKEEDLPIPIKQVSKLTTLSVPTLYGYCQRGEIPHHKKGNRLYFFKSEIIDWIKTGKNKTNKEIESEIETYLSNKNKRLK